MTGRPLHERIRREIEGQILSGALAPGDRLPIESAYMERYGCARMTVNKAMSSLADAGLIERRKRAGTFVARPRVHSMILDIPDLAAEIAARGQSYRYQPIEVRCRMPRPADPVESSLGDASEILDVTGLHLADAVPLAFEQRLISLAAVPEARTVDFTIVSPGSWLLAHVPWTEAESRISAVAAGIEVAAALDVEPRTACLLVERRTWRGGEDVTLVRQYFPGDAYDLTARFGP